MTEETLEPINDIKDIFENVNQWLSFIELKNGALVAFDIAFLVFLEEIKDNTLCGKICSLLIVISLIVSLYSYYPNLKNYNQDSSFWGYNTNGTNLLFFGNLTQLSSIDFLKNIYSNYYNKKQMSNFSQREIHYAEEIIINAKIASAKANLFKISLVCVLVGISILTIRNLCNFLCDVFSLLLPLF